MYSAAHQDTDGMLLQSDEEPPAPVPDQSGSGEAQKQAAVAAAANPANKKSPGLV